MKYVDTFLPWHDDISYKHVTYLHSHRIQNVHGLGQQILGGFSWRLADIPLQFNVHRFHLNNFLPVSSICAATQE